VPTGDDYRTLPGLADRKLLLGRYDRSLLDPARDPGYRLNRPWRSPPDRCRRRR
jgi:hypothetical protein